MEPLESPLTRAEMKTIFTHTMFKMAHQSVLLVLQNQKIALSSIESLIQQIYQDLNNYSECCIPLDTSNSVDIKLFPILPPPINIKAYQVPIVTVRLNSLVDVNWDPTMIKILPYINGLNSVKKISELADANYLLTKQCIQHLMHYKCIEVIDIFQFGNIYAPTNHIGEFLKHDGKMAEECQAYVVSADFSMDNTSYVNTPTQMHLPYPGSDAHSPTYNYRYSYGTSSVSPYTKYSFCQGHRKILWSMDLMSKFLQRLHCFTYTDRLIKVKPLRNGTCNIKNIGKC